MRRWGDEVPVPSAAEVEARPTYVPLHNLTEAQVRPTEPHRMAGQASLQPLQSCWLGDGIRCQWEWQHACLEREPITSLSCRLPKSGGTTLSSPLYATRTTVRCRSIDTAFTATWLFLQSVQLW